MLNPSKEEGLVGVKYIVVDFQEHSCRKMYLVSLPLTHKI